MSSLEVGRPLDEAVFEQVYDFVRWPKADKDGEAGYLHLTEGDVWHGDPPGYSTDLTEAWCLAEDMHDSNEPETRALLAEAICRAALLAIEKRGGKACGND